MKRVGPKLSGAKKVKVSDLLAMVPDTLLEQIGKDLKVDRPYQKLTGLKMFKVLLYSLAETTRISLRNIADTYNHLFKEKFLGSDNSEKTRHSSLADRLSKINPDYFESIFNFLVEISQKLIDVKKYKNVYRFDSTLMGLSAKLLSKIGINCGGDARSRIRHFKVTVGQKGVIPSFVRFCTKKSESSESIALKEAILDAKVKSTDIVVFDRGLSGGNGFCELDKEEILFVTRTKTSRKVKVVENFTIEHNSTETLNILSDQKVLLFGKKGTKFKTPFRFIRARCKKNNEEICFMTNIFTMAVTEITEIYRSRWDIEVFFRFVKQELNLSHFLARNLNGMKVYVYMILIFAILLLVYKTKNNLSGYKFVKKDFFRELEGCITADIIERYGGDKQSYLADMGLA